MLHHRDVDCILVLHVDIVNMSIALQCYMVTSPTCRSPSSAILVTSPTCLQCYITEAWTALSCCMVVSPTCRWLSRATWWRHRHVDRTPVLHGDVTDTPIALQCCTVASPRCRSHSNATWQGHGGLTEMWIALECYMAGPRWLHRDVDRTRMLHGRVNWLPPLTTG